MRVFCCFVMFLFSLSTAARSQQEVGSMPNQRTREAIDLMAGFAERTGLSSDRPQQRYLWTDAFAVCTFLSLARATGEKRYTDMALRLVDHVHHTLGRYRSDEPRKGWISGLSEEEGELHPTRGGLRIGKRLPERRPDQALDERLEWDRDGQYFHYLTKWMHALDQVARFTGQPSFNTWARELAGTAHAAFVYRPTGVGPRRMVWKMSIDLKRALVSSMGQHDPLDGYITYIQLDTTADAFGKAHDGPELANAARQMEAMIVSGDLATADPLGLGGLMVDAYRVRQLAQHGRVGASLILDSLLSAALAGMRVFAENGQLELPAEQRLAFRELGLAIGLQALRRLSEAADSDSTRARLGELMHFARFGEIIETFWREPKNRQSPSWSEHRDINEVMLATSLVPEGFLVLLTPD